MKFIKEKHINNLNIYQIKKYKYTLEVGWGEPNPSPSHPSSRQEKPMQKRDLQDRENHARQDTSIEPSLFEN